MVPPRPPARSGQEGFFSAAVLGLPGAQLFVEALGHRGHFLDGGVVLLLCTLSISAFCSGVTVCAATLASYSP
jgi:hypothetical protein